MGILKLSHVLGRFQVSDSRQYCHEIPPRDEEMHLAHPIPSIRACVHTWMDGWNELTQLIRLSRGIFICTWRSNLGLGRERMIRKKKMNHPRHGGKTSLALLGCLKFLVKVSFKLILADCGMRLLFWAGVKGLCGYTVSRYSTVQYSTVQHRIE